jgi:predicted nucleotidyltransferase
MLGKEFELIRAFLFEPSKELYGREIERLAGTTHERTIFYLKKLVENKVLLSEKKGKQVFYRLNKRNEMALKAISLAELERKNEFIKNNEIGFVAQDIVSDAVEECPASVYFVLLFGSSARGEHRKTSDIDLLFVLNKNDDTKAKLEEVIRKKEIITGKKISLHIVDLEEIMSRWLKEPVYKNIWEERIVFFGEENFWRFVFRRGEPS